MDYCLVIRFLGKIVEILGKKSCGVLVFDS